MIITSSIVDNLKDRVVGVKTDLIRPYVSEDNRVLGESTVLSTGVGGYGDCRFTRYG